MEIFIWVFGTLLSGIAISAAGSATYEWLKSVRSPSDMTLLMDTISKAVHMSRSDPVRARNMIGEVRRILLEDSWLREEDLNSEVDDFLLQDAPKAEEFRTLKTYFRQKKRAVDTRRRQAVVAAQNGTDAPRGA